MVHELHKRGFQNLAIYTGMSASGLYWRCEVLPLEGRGGGDSKNARRYVRTSIFSALPVLSRRELRLCRMVDLDPWGC